MGKLVSKQLRYLSNYRTKYKDTTLLAATYFLEGVLISRNEKISMGTSSSKLVKKVLTPSGNKGSRERQDETKNPHYSRSGTSFDDIRPKKAIKRTNSITSIDPEVDMITASLNLPPGIGPVVLYRQGSMYFDEDGDLAHEFYAEVNNGGKSKMIRVYENLHPQGKVRLPHPMLRSDCPVILHVL